MRFPRITNVLAIAALGMAALAMSQRPLSPAVVATVDIERIFQEIESGAAADQELQELYDDLERQFKDRRDAISLLQEDLPLYVPGTPDYQKIEQEITRKAFELRAFEQFATRKKDFANAQALLDLYQEIRDEIAAIAGEFDYDIVFVDDSIVPLPQSASEQETMRQISARRMLFTNKRLDITDLVVERLNRP